VSDAEFYRAYDALLARWPVPVEPVDVASVYGTTRVSVCGPADGEPLVLLHGGGATSTVWFGVVGELSRRYRVYAVDQLGDVGRSVAGGIPLGGPGDLMSWLDGLFDHFGLDGGYVVGHSYGAWLALSYTLHAPARVGRLALLDPTGCFAGLSPSYVLHALPLLTRPRADRARSFLRWETAGAPVDPGWVDVYALGAEQPKAKTVMPRRPSPRQLLASEVPALVLLAEQSRCHDVRRVEARARTLLRARTATLPGATHHSIPAAGADRIARELLAFR
jgi:pimeloyl-ACP methyl ester carboxylesterase